MGRGKGKGKKQAAIDAHEGEEEKIPPYKRRGRLQKTAKEEIGKEKGEKIEGEEGNEDNTTSVIANKDVKNQAAVENGGRRMRFSQVNANADSVQENNGNDTKTSTDGSPKFVGFRQNGSRRKNKPRRAAEVGVECK